MYLVLKLNYLKVLKMEEKKSRIFRLARDVSKLFHDESFKEIDKLGVRRAYGFLMKPIAENDGLTQLELCKLTHFKASSISLSLKQMESDGYIRREQDSNDLRAVRIFLTDKGREADDEIKAIFARNEEKLLKNIPKEDLETAKRVLETILQGLIGEQE